MKVESRETEHGENYFLMPDNKILASRVRGIVNPNVDESLSFGVKMKANMALIHVFDARWGNVCQELEKAISGDFMPVKATPANKFAPPAIKYCDYSDTIRLFPSNYRLLVSSKGMPDDCKARRYMIDFDGAVPQEFSMNLLSKILKKPEMLDYEPEKLAALLDSVLQKHLSSKMPECTP
jgi:hypothetical protein